MVRAGTTWSPPVPRTRRERAPGDGVSIWLLPALVAVVGTIPVAILSLRAAEEAGELLRQLRGFGELRPALVELRTAGRAMSASLREKSGT